jgi:hypothetical protein
MLEGMMVVEHFQLKIQTFENSKSKRRKETAEMEF